MGDLPAPGETPEEPGPPTVGYIVTVQSQYLGRVQEVADRLESAGMEIERVLGTLGQIVCRAQESMRETLAAVEGVQSVDPERRFGIAPPDSEIQ